MLCIYKGKYFIHSPLTANITLYNCTKKQKKEIKSATNNLYQNCIVLVQISIYFTIFISGGTILISLRLPRQAASSTCK